MALNNVPNPGQTLVVTRNPINQNFSTINAAFLVDHVEYNLSGQGKHNKVTFPNQLAAPTFTNPEIGLYNFVSPVTTINELFIRNSSGVTTPITASAQTANGWSYLPSGLLIKWGSAAVTRNTLSTVTFPIGATIPAFTSIFMVQSNQTFNAGPSTGDLNTAPCTGNITTTNFQVYARANGLPNSGSINVFYFAIGI